MALPRFDWPSLERQARLLLAEWRRVLARNVLEAREVLRELLEAPLAFTPIEQDGSRGYRFEGAVKLGEPLAGICRVQAMASPGGSRVVTQGLLPC
jgi:hypothetical protein